MYKLKELPYSYEDLEPYIDTHTLGLHYNKHTKGYLNKLNTLLNLTNYDYRYKLEELPKHINEFNKEDQQDILFNLGGVINHEIYFNSMIPKKIEPKGSFLNEINKYFKSYENFKKEFKNTALELKGSGYTFLVVDSNYNLKIINLKDQDTPYLYNLIPLIALDLWEHAYYINYENKKDLYIDNFFEIINFDFANKLYNNIKM